MPENVTGVQKRTERLVQVQIRPAQTGGVTRTITSDGFLSNRSGRCPPGRLVCPRHVTAFMIFLSRRAIPGLASGGSSTTADMQRQTRSHEVLHRLRIRMSVTTRSRGRVSHSDDPGIADDLQDRPSINKPRDLMVVPDLTRFPQLVGGIQEMSGRFSCQRLCGAWLGPRRTRVRRSVFFCRPVRLTAAVVLSVRPPRLPQARRRQTADGPLLDQRAPGTDRPLPRVPQRRAGHRSGSGRKNHPGAGRSICRQSPDVRYRARTTNN